MQYGVASKPSKLQNGPWHSLPPPSLLQHTYNSDSPSSVATMTALVLVGWLEQGVSTTSQEHCIPTRNTPEQKKTTVIYIPLLRYKPFIYWLIFVWWKISHGSLIRKNFQSEIKFGWKIIFTNIARFWKFLLRNISIVNVSSWLRLHDIQVRYTYMYMYIYTGMHLGGGPCPPPFPPPPQVSSSA